MARSAERRGNVESRRERWRVDAPTPSASLVVMLRPLSWNPRREHAPLSQLGLHLDDTPEQTCQTLRDEQAEAGSAIAAREAGIELREGLKEARHVGGGNADAGVA